MLPYARIMVASMSARTSHHPGMASITGPRASAQIQVLFAENFARKRRVRGDSQLIEKILPACLAWSSSQGEFPRLLTEHVCLVGIDPVVQATFLDVAEGQLADRR